MKKILLLPILVFIILCGAACSNSNNKSDKDYTEQYNAVLYDYAEKYCNKSFLQANKTHYPFADDDLPEYRCITIKTEDEFNNAFSSLPHQIDFEHDILVLYIFTDINYGFSCELHTITKTETTLNIRIRHTGPEEDENGCTPPMGSAPTQRCHAVKLTDCEYNTFTFD